MHAFRELADRVAPARQFRVAEWINDPALGVAAISEACDNLLAAVDRGELPGNQVSWLAEAAIAWHEEMLTAVYTESEEYDDSDMPMCATLRHMASDDFAVIADRNIEAECEGCPSCRGAAG